MNHVLRDILIIIAAIVVLALGAMIYNGIGKTKAVKRGGVACTLEAKLCPDGSAVGRTGPNCEFSECPNTVASTSDTASGNGGTAGGIMPFNSGVKGVVMLGPTCPVMKNPPEEQCADKPYSTLVTIFRKSDPVHAFVLTKSDVEGKFSASLPPGDYILGAGDSNLPRCDHPEVTVGPTGYVSVTISCDTGIR